MCLIPSSNSYPSDLRSRYRNHSPNPIWHRTIERPLPRLEGEEATIEPSQTRLTFSLFCTIQLKFRISYYSDNRWKCFIKTQWLHDSPIMTLKNFELEALQRFAGRHLANLNYTVGPATKVLLFYLYNRLVLIFQMYVSWDDLGSSPKAIWICRNLIAPFLASVCCFWGRWCIFFE